MKKTILIVLLATAFSLAAGTAAEARASKNIPSNSDSIETRASAAERSTSRVSFSGGVSSISAVPGSILFLGGSLTGILQITHLDAIQLFLGIGATSPGFSFGVGGVYKRTLMGGESAGFHLGGGFGLGTLGQASGTGSATDFTMTIPAVVGVHFKVPNTGVAFHFDGGAAFSLLAATSTDVNFSVGQLSRLMGASVVYEF